jgi:hypothetical protein
LPYLRAWHHRYKEHGLVILGVHTPEFSFAHDAAQVKAAVGRLGVSWPVILDNDQKVWRSYANRYWPTIYVIDSDGYIRYQHTGEGNYAEIEKVIQSLLRRITPDFVFPDIMAPLRAEDETGAVCFPTTPELHVGSIGNAEPILGVPSICEIPENRMDGRFYLHGLWQAEKDGFVMTSEHGTIILPYHAASVNGVFAPSSDPAEIALGFPSSRSLEVSQDGAPLPKSHSTADLFFSDDRAFLRVENARSYALVENPNVQPRELQLDVQGSGFSIYAFSFGSCHNPGSDPAQSVKA